MTAGWSHQEDVAGVSKRRDDSDDICDDPNMKEDHAQTILKSHSQVVSLSNEKTQAGVDATQHNNSKLDQGQSENNSCTMAYSNTHFDERMSSIAGQLWKGHFTYSVSSSTSTLFHSKPRRTANPQTGGESTYTTPTSRRCHPLCFIGSRSSYQTYSVPLGDESWPLPKGKRSVPLSSIITECHPFGLGYDDFFFDDGDSDAEEDDGEIGM